MAVMAVTKTRGAYEYAKQQRNAQRPTGRRERQRLRHYTDHNGQDRGLTVEPRETLLDALRERLLLTGTKKGCDHGQCGACTVHINGERTLACLTLAVMQQGQRITTIEGLAEGNTLHLLQQAFIEHDGFQCGFCTPGQIMSAAALLREGHARTEDEIRELMSGNICRCGAYNGIVEAIATVMEVSDATV